MFLLTLYHNRLCVERVIGGPDSTGAFMLGIWISLYNLLSSGYPEDKSNKEDKKKRIKNWSRSGPFSEPPITLQKEYAT